MSETVDVVMPRLSDSMEEGIVLSWLKSVGDEVARGEDLVEIETDKANMVYEADAAGTLIELLAAEGESLPVGAVIARIGTSTSASTPSMPPERGRALGIEAEVETPDAVPAEVHPGPGGSDRLRASPLARRLAAARSIGLEAVEGSGPFGRILKADVLRATPRPQQPVPQPSARAEAVGAGTATAKGDIETVELSRLQQVLARRMAESKATAPHFYLSVEVDMSAAVAARGRLKQAGLEILPSLNDFVVKAAALALREHPRANGSFRDGRFELYSEINVGIAVAGEDALVVPTIFAADRRGLSGIAVASRTAAGKVRDGTITPPELSGGTFTVSNLGMFGIGSFAAVVNPPQAAILAVGEVAEAAVVRNGELRVAPMMTATLSCDHRILYGAEGAALLGRIRSILEDPITLAL